MDRASDLHPDDLRDVRLLPPPQCYLHSSGRDREQEPSPDDSVEREHPTKLSIVWDGSHSISHSNNLWFIRWIDDLSSRGME